MTLNGANSLPKGWSQAKIGELVGPDGIFIDGDWVESKDQDPEGNIRLIQLADVGDGEYRNRSARFLTAEKAEELNCTFLTVGDVLIARMPDPLGRACIYPGDAKRAVTVVDVCIVRTGEIGADHRWLIWAVNSPDFRSAIAGMQSGSTRKRISRGNLSTLVLPIPPLAEQRRIADEVEKQFTRLDAAVAALKRVQANLKRYRAAVLKAACEGRLVPTEAELARRENRSYEPASVLLERVLTERRSRWEAGQRLTFEDSGRIPKDDEWKSKYQQPVSPAFPLLELPEGWGWGTLLQISWDANYGTSEKCDYEWPGPAVLRIPNVVNGKVDLADLKHANKSLEFNHADTVTTGDMLIVRTNGSRDLIGRSVVVQEPFSKPHLFASYLIRYRLVGEPGLLDWVRATWNNPQNRVRIESLAATTAGQYNVSLSKLNSLPIPLPPADEMQRVANEIDRRVSTIDKLENEVRVNLEKAGRLRQSILDQAFKGELVSQDPSDESARVLLERIRAEREVESRVSRKGAKEIVTR